MEKAIVQQDVKTTGPDFERTSSILTGEMLHSSDDSKLYAKIDRHIMPLAFLCYFLQFLDKVVINYARVMGIESSLGMAGQDFSWMATAFFIAYAVAEFPQGVLLQKLPLSKLLGCNVLCWGVLLACSAAAQNFAGMVAIRSLLGAFESIITPALILITSQWYTKRQACPRIGIWYCGLGAGQIVGGLISWAGQHGSKTASFEGWRIMMVSVGVFNILVALAVIFALPDSVETASFLSPSEKERVIQKLTVDQAGNGKRIFKKAALFEALADPAIWLLFLITILILVPSGVVTTFSATILAGLGYNSKKAALLNMGSGAVSIFATLASTFAILFNVSRWLSIVLLIIPSLIGAALMSFLGDMRGAGLAGVYLVNFCVAPSALTYALVASNTQGYTKKVVANCGMQVAFGIGNIIGPQTFRAHEAPDYLSAKITVMSVNAGVIVVAILLRLLYGHRNKKRDQASNAQDRLGVEVQRDTEDATDLTNPAFRYVY